MGLIQPNRLLKGIVSLQSLDSNNPEAINSEGFIKIDSLLFTFNDCNLCVNLRSFDMNIETYNNKTYLNNFNGHGCRFEQGFAQKVQINENSLIFISGVFEILDGLCAEKFKLHGYFKVSKDLQLNVNTYR